MRWKFFVTPRFAIQGTSADDTLEKASSYQTATSNLPPVNAAYDSFIYRSHYTNLNYILMPEYHPMFNMNFIYEFAHDEAMISSNFHTYNKLTDLFDNTVGVDVSI